MGDIRTSGTGAGAAGGGAATVGCGAGAGAAGGGAATAGCGALAEGCGGSALAGAGDRVALVLGAITSIVGRVGAVGAVAGVPGAGAGVSAAGGGSLGDGTWLKARSTRTTQPTITAMPHRKIHIRPPAVLLSKSYATLLF